MSDPSDNASDNVQLSETVMSLIQGGRKVHAIKQLRREQGLGLAEAKDLVDRAEAQLPPTSSADKRRAPATEDRGGLRLLLIVVIGGVVLAALLTSGLIS